MFELVRLIPPLKKQAQLPLNKAIIKFDQLKSRFAGSEWAVFFEPEEISVEKRAHMGKNSFTGPVYTMCVPAGMLGIW